jgi:predicted transposase/invertase (TIGR01784 family)
MRFISKFDIYNVLMSKLNPRVDFVFKLIFGSEENKDILMSFINSVVSDEDQVQDLTLRNPFTSKSYQQGKLIVLDIRAIDISGRHYNIEMQITDQLDYEKRALYYWSDIYAKQLSEGAKYSDLKKTIGIHVLNFDLLDEPDFHNRYYVTNHKSKKRAFSDLELHTIELKKFNTEITQVKTTLERWVTFLTKAYTFKKDTLPPTLEDPMVKKAAHVLDTLNLDDEERLLYEGQLKWLRDEEAGIDKAYARGLAARKELFEAEKQRLEAEKEKAEAEKEKAEAEREKAEEKLEAEKQKAEIEKRNMAQKMEISGINKETIRRITGIENW